MVFHILKCLFQYISLFLERRLNNFLLLHGCFQEGNFPQLICMQIHFLISEIFLYKPLFAHFYDMAVFQKIHGLIPFQSSQLHQWGFFDLSQCTGVEIVRFPVFWFSCLIDMKFLLFSSFLLYHLTSTGCTFLLFCLFLPQKLFFPRMLSF